MVGKLNLPHDAEKRKDVHGSASGGPGLTAVDEERAASMADEGGASGSAVESQETERAEEDPKSPRDKGAARRRRPR